MAHQTPSPPHDGHPLYLRVITGFIFAVLLGIGPVAHSQLITETQWFFGNSKANLQFDKNGDRVYGETRMVGSFGMGGPAVISDQYTGNLLFYCDGQAIYDASHRVVPGGSGLAGNPSINQSAVACPLPASGTQYFIFTNSGSTGVNEIRYTTVDASRAGNGSGNAPLGEALVSNSATGLTDPAEAMIIVESQVPQLYWLISQNRTTFDFRVTRITPAGIGTTQVFNLDTTTTLPGAVASQFAYNKDSMLLAVAPRTANRNILLLDFNDTLGTLSVRKSILRTGYNDGAGESVYDLEWSGDGSKLYFSRFGGVSPNTGQVYQVDLLDSLAAVNRVMSAPVYRSLGLKRGIDDRIYHLFQAVDGGPYQLGRFDQVDSVAGVVTYQAPFLTTDFNGRQFPQFAPPDFQASQFTMDFYYLDSCQNDATKFFARIDPAPNTIYWTFGDGSSSSAVAPIHTYGGPGAYFVNLHAELNGRVGIYSQLVEVFANDLLVNLGSDTVICVNETLTLDAGAGGTSYQWSTGETTQTIVVDTAGTYWVEMTGPTGCTAFDAIEVTEYGISQQLANQWYFGEMAGLDFNIQPDGTPPPVALADNNKMFSPEGCATISDTDGHLLFYTNGVTVWNRDHDVMPIYDPSSTSPFLGGNNTASQGVLILPFMGDETMFYIFTAEEVYGDLAYDLRYSIVDMKKDSADGAIVVKDVPLFQKSTEKITASGFSVSAWLISHEFGNNNFRSNLVTDNGIGSTIHTPVGNVLEAQSPEMAAGTMKFATGLQFFANLIPGSNLIELLDFDMNSGHFDTLLVVDAAESQNLYGLEFSPDNLRMYVTAGGKLIQFDLDSINTRTAKADIEASKFDGYGSFGNLGALQRGPNGIIYLAADGNNALMSINTPGGNDLSAGFSAAGIDLLGRTSRLGLPNFTQFVGALPTAPGMSYLSACYGQPTSFFGTGTSIIDEYFWKFDTTATFPTAIGAAVNTTYSVAGQHIVELTITNRCGYDSIFVDTLTLNQIPEIPQIAKEYNLCNGPLELAAWFEDRPDLSYYWFPTGDTTRTITVTTPMPELKVTIINSAGCSSDTLTAFVRDNRPYVYLGSDRDYCQFDPAPPLDANVSNVAINWSVDGLLNPANKNNRYQAIDTSIPGVYQFAVSITEPFFKCTQQDTVEVVINEAPALDYSFSPPTICGAYDATLAFEIQSSGTFSYALSSVNLTDGGTLDGPVSSATYGGLPAGNFLLDVQNVVTACEATLPMIIEDDALFDVNASNLPDCVSDYNLLMTLSGVSLPELVNIYILSAAGDTLYLEEDATVPILTYPALDTGLYFVNIEDVSNGCLQADSVYIRPYLPVASDCKPRIVAPNAFSPNGNGYNEEFFIYPNAFIDKFEIFIYSRWGELVYYADRQDFRWDGSFNGAIMGPDTFAYTIRYTSIEEPQLGVLVQYGAVTIVK